MTTNLSLLLLFACAFTSSSNPSSCRGRCGEGYYRGSHCQCDHECLGLNECCTDFLDLCTTKDSCKGRCGEPFNRGNPCHCDIDCITYTQCCPDYENMCLIEDTALKSRYHATAAHRIANLCLNIKNKKPTETSNEEMTNEEGIGDELMIPHEESVSEGLDASSRLPVDENREESVTEQTTPSTPQPQEKTSTALTESPTNTAPTESPASTAPTESPASTALTEGPTSTAPTESPASTALTEGPTSTALTEGPTSTALTEGPTSTAPTEGPTSTAPAEGPTSTAPAEGPTSTALTDSPTSTALTEDATSTASSESPTSTAPTGPTNAAPTGVSTITAPLEGSTDAEPPEHLTSMASSVPEKTPPIPGPVKPTKKPTLPSADKNDKSDPKDPKDLTGIATNRPGENPRKSSDINGKTESIKDYQADDYDKNICSGRPVSGLTTLRNGTIVVFRGHYFWTLDKHRNPDPPQLITRVWGIPSPIDTVYTRCNCQGKTYFFKGKNYWRFENGLMDPGFPKPISQGFGKIDHITAALSIPEYRSRRESVIFFKRGGLAQKYTYQVTPNCGKQLTNSVVTVRMRTRRQAAAALEQKIDISKNWTGFPTMVTSAISVPSRVREGYKYYIFSPRNYYSMKMERERPVILQTSTGQKENPATSFFKCRN